MENSNLRSGCDKLQCSAVNCTYNESYECRAGAIKVGGREAVTTDETYCDSFVDQKDGGLTNSVENGCTNPNNIKCEALKCKYNESERCVADNVKINKDNTSCQTFIKR